MKAAWDYGGAHRRHDMEGEIALPHGSRVAVCDWTERLPDFMRDADTLFIDPPWNAGNVRTFYTKADLERGRVDFECFCRTLLGRIDEIAPRTLFVEMGKEWLGWWLERCRERYKYVTFYNSTYYGRKANKCYVIHATSSGNRRRYPELEDLDEADIIAWICREHPYECIGDLCMGLGLVGRHAYAAGRRFVGTELNPKRLATLVEHIRTEEARRGAVVV